MPKGRLSLDGPIPPKYQLNETPSSSYPQRTEWNVRDSDGTVVFTMAPTVTGGSLKTIGFAMKHRKPCIHVSMLGDQSGKDRSMMLRHFILEYDIRILNVAGSRESKEPGIYQWVMRELAGAFFWEEDHCKNSLTSEMKEVLWIAREIEAERRAVNITPSTSPNPPSPP